MKTRKLTQPQCAATTAKGKPCTNAAKAGSDRCGAHGGKVGPGRLGELVEFLATACQ